MKRLITVIALFTSSLFLWVDNASANITYAFSGVTFDDGGTLTGTFTTNNTDTALVDFDITTSLGSNIGFQAHGGSRGHQSDKRRTGFRPDPLLLRFGAVDPDQPYPSAIAAAETVAV